MPLPKAKVLRERVLTTKLREARRSGKPTPVFLTVLTCALFTRWFLKAVVLVAQSNCIDEASPNCWRPVRPQPRRPPWPPPRPQIRSCLCLRSMAVETWELLSSAGARKRSRLCARSLLSAMCIADRIALSESHGSTSEPKEQDRKSVCSIASPYPQKFESSDKGCGVENQETGQRKTPLTLKVLLVLVLVLAACAWPARQE